MTIVRARWHPATVRLPDGTEKRLRYVVVAEGGEHAGLWVYDQPDHVEFHAGINWLRQAPIPAGRGVKTGVDIQLADGTTAVITPGTPCRCRSLGRWRGPAWANTVGARA